jgi:RNA 3'-terminal phosphate cyclase (ATP)
MIKIDGSIGEGGGQILRSSLSLSMVTGKPFTIINLRAGRQKPGLSMQHLMAVKAATAISNAEVKGDFLGSRDLIFKPWKLSPQEYIFDIGTAGSATLLLQTLLPPLLTAEGPLKLNLMGGTHNPFAPPFDFIQKTYLELIKKMGPQINTKLDTYGFYPAGGGAFEVQISPSKDLQPLEILERGKLQEINCWGIVSKLPIEIARNEVQLISKNLPVNSGTFFEVDSPGPGNIIMIEIKSKNITEIFTGFGERGVYHEVVAQNVIKMAKHYLHGVVPVGKFLADQLLVPMAISGGGKFRTLNPTLHTLTSIEIINKFMNLKIDNKPLGEDMWEISINRE